MHIKTEMHFLYWL